MIQDDSYQWLIDELHLADHFDQRELKAILACLFYGDDPFGDVAHNLKIIVAKLVKLAKFEQDKLNGQ